MGTFNLSDIVIKPYRRLGLLLGFTVIFIALITKVSPSHSDDNSPLAQPINIYKSPTCGCCGDWVEHIKKAGFNPLVKHPRDLNAVKKKLNIAPEYQSCHTAVQGAFIFEGHIPAKFIQQFMDNPPADAIGLAVPAMPLGSPGMEMGQRFTPYTIYQLQADGSRKIFAKITNPEKQY